jgi:hypothetical protein
LFITSAVESVDDDVWPTRGGAHATASCRRPANVDRRTHIVPTFVAFTPWTSIDGYIDLLNVVEELDLVAHVAPVQWGIRLLVTWASRLLELDDIRSRVGLRCEDIVSWQRAIHAWTPCSSGHGACRDHDEFSVRRV